MKYFDRVKLSYNLLKESLLFEIFMDRMRIIIKTFNCRIILYFYYLLSTYSPLQRRWG